MKKGFTLIELLGVIVIIGILALITVPAVDGTIKKGKQKAYEMTKDTIISATKNWLTDNKGLFDDGDTLMLTLSDLKEHGYLDFDIKNPSSGACLDSTMEVEVTRTGKKYNIAIVDDELVDGKNSDCEAVSRVPSIYLLGDNPLNIEINSTFNDPGAKATDTDGNDISGQIVTAGTIDTSVITDNIKYKYTVLSDGATKSITRKINVVDTVAPLISGTDDITIYTSNTTFNIMDGVSVIDNSGETITIKTKSNLSLGVKGVYTVTYIATDSSGNVETVTRKITIDKGISILKQYSSGNYFWNETYNSKIESIEFVDYANTTGSAISWDLSLNNDGSITGWLMTDIDNPSYYKMYIGSTNYIYANPDSSNWFYNLSSLYSINFSNFNTSNVTSMGGMFYTAKVLNSLDLSGFNTSNVTNMSSMFYYANGLTNLNLSGFNTANVKYMNYMFSGVWDLASLDLSSFDTSNVENMNSMFAGLYSLNNLDLSGFNTSKVTDMQSMFRVTSGLSSLDLSNFNTANVNNMNAMFYGASGLTSLDLSSFVTSKVTNMSEMFYYASRLTSLNLSSFNTSIVTNMQSMFHHTIELATIDLSSFNTTAVTNMNSMFLSSTKLTTIYVGANWTQAGATTVDMFTGCGTATVTLK